MGLLRSLADSFDKKVDGPKTFIQSGSLLTSGRFIALIAMVALIVYKVCDPATLTTLLWAFGIYTAGNTITRTAQILGDAWIHREDMRSDAWARRNPLPPTMPPAVIP